MPSITASLVPRVCEPLDPFASLRQQMALTYLIVEPKGKRAVPDKLLCFRVECTLVYRSLPQLTAAYRSLPRNTINSTEPRKTAINLDLMYDVVKTMPDEGGKQ